MLQEKVRYQWLRWNTLSCRGPLLLVAAPVEFTFRLTRRFQPCCLFFYSFEAIEFVKGQHQTLTKTLRRGARTNTLPILKVTVKWGSI